MTWDVNVLTLFPELFPGPLEASVIGNARQNNIWQLNVTNIRDFAKNKYKTVDDSPYGGGVGMVLKPDIVGNAIEAVIKEKHYKPKMVYFSPRGKKFSQDYAKDLINNQSVLFICGRYEGLDQRVIDYYDIEELSLGDYILTGGEYAAYCVIDCCVRLLPSVLLKEEATERESFENGLLEHPHYTRPQIWNDLSVPQILVSGDHAKIDEWRLKESEDVTRTKRPDLWKKYQEE